jgi:hypothetical protein
MLFNRSDKMIACPSRGQWGTKRTHHVGLADEKGRTIRKRPFIHRHFSPSCSMKLRDRVRKLINRGRSLHRIR